MEAMAVSSATSTAALSCVGACKRSKRNTFSASASSSSSPRSSLPQRKQKQKNIAVAAAAAQGDSSAAAAQERGRRQLNGVVCRELGSLTFASFLLSGLGNVQSALALSYDEVVGTFKEAASTSTPDSLPFDLPELPAVDTSSLTDFVSTNPLAILGGGAVLALPLIASAVFKKSEGFGSVSAKEAYTQLGDEEIVTQLLDIRAGEDVKAEGSPDLKAYKKKAIQLPYSGTEPEEYLDKVLKKFKDAENTTVYVLDRFGGDSAAVAKLLAQGGFKAAYGIKDGAEGPSGWQTSLPWQVPSKGFSLDFGKVKEVFSTADTGSVLPTTLGVAAAAGVGLVVFSEAEVALQLLGSAALAQIFVKKFLFAKDRKKTIAELKTFLDTKVAPKEVVEELKEVADTIFPTLEEVQEVVSANGVPLVDADFVESTTTAVENAVAEAPTAVEEATTAVENAAAEAPTAVEEATTAVENAAAEAPAAVEEATTAVENAVADAEVPTAVEEASTAVENAAEEAPAAVEEATTAVENAAAEAPPAVEEATTAVQDAAAEAPSAVEEATTAVENTAAEAPAAVEEATTAVENAAAEAPTAVEEAKSAVEDGAAEAPTAVEEATIATPLAATTPAEPIKEEATASSSTDLPYTATPLSPYTQFPGLKPPTSPTPSRPGH